MDKNATKANNIVSALYAVRGLPHKDRLYLVKTLVLPILLYPCIPLNVCSPSNMLKLQIVQNRALKFVYGIRYPVLVTARTLHVRAKLKPINVVLHTRAINIWRKLAAGTAGDQATYNMIDGISIERPHGWFPSSLDRSGKATPPPDLHSVRYPRPDR